MWLRLIAFPVLLLAGFGVIAGALAGLGDTARLSPSALALTDYQPKQHAVGVRTVHRSVSSARSAASVVAIGDVPRHHEAGHPCGIEDERFISTVWMSGGVIRAAYSNLTAGGRRQGASTITMQVARNFFLSRKKRLRKLYEALLAFKIEASLSKDVPAAVHQPDLPGGARRFAEAAQIYGKALKDVNVAEAAMLAGLPKAPSSFNPAVNPKRAPSNGSCTCCGGRR